jgi:hypothetical protein
MATVDAIELETKDKDLYRHVAEQPHDAYHFETGHALAERPWVPGRPSRQECGRSDRVLRRVGYFVDLADLRPGDRGSRRAPVRRREQGAAGRQATHRPAETGLRPPLAVHGSLDGGQHRPDLALQPFGKAAAGSRRFRFPGQPRLTRRTPRAGRRPPTGCRLRARPMAPPRPRSSPGSARGSSADSADGRRASLSTPARRDVSSKCCALSRSGAPTARSPGSCSLSPRTIDMHLRNVLTSSAVARAPRRHAERWSSACSRAIPREPDGYPG